MTSMSDEPSRAMTSDGPFGICVGYCGGHTRLIEVKSETAKTVMAIEKSDYSSRWSDAPRRMEMAKIIARFPTLDAALTAQEAGAVAWKSHTASVTAARLALTAAEIAQREAWRLAMLSQPKEPA